jgi:menaquinone-dependent protoporphyrinogen oxidase
MNFSMHNESSNMTKKVLIAYGTRFGSTEEIANSIAETMKAQGLNITVLNVKKDEWPSLSQFDAVLIGSGIKMGRWTKEAKKYLKQHVKDLKTKSFVGIFVSSGEASEADKYEEAKEKYVKKIIRDFGLELNTVKYEAFGGVFDLTASSRMGWFDKKFSNMAAKDEENPHITENAYNDLRDWDQIHSYALEASKKILQF